MTCTDVDSFLSEGKSLIELRSSVELRGHIEHCARCRDLVSWVEAPLPAPAISGGSMQRISSLLRADLRPVKPVPTIFQATVSICLVAAIIATLHTLAMGSRGWATLSLPQQVLVFGLCMLVALTGTASLLESVRPGSRKTIHPLLPLVAISAGFPVLVAALFPFGVGTDFITSGLRCLAGGIMLAGMTAAAAYSIIRGGYSTDWRRSGALLGTVSAAVAIGVLQVSCPDQELGHLLVWHGSAILLSILSGLAFGRKLAASD